MSSRNWGAGKRSFTRAGAIVVPPPTQPPDKPDPLSEAYFRLISVAYELSLISDKLLRLAMELQEEKR